MSKLMNRHSWRRLECSMASLLPDGDLTAASSSRSKKGELNLPISSRGRTSFRVPRPFPERTSSALTSNPLGILSSRGGRIREASSAGRKPAPGTTIAYQVADVKNYLEAMSSPFRNVPFLRFVFLVLRPSWFVLFVLVVVGVVVETRPGLRPERSPAEPEGRSV